MPGKRRVKFDISIKLDSLNIKDLKKKITE